MKKIAISFAVLAVSVCLVGPQTANALTVDELQAQINALLAQLATLQAQLGTTGGTVSGCTITAFNTNLTIGSTGNDVKCLQVILNSNAATQVATTGAGSPGNETMYFGGLTQAAVKKFQTTYGISPVAGFVGPITRAKLNTMIGTGGTVIPTTPGTVSVALSATNPASGTFVAGALVTDPSQSNAKLAEFTFAGSGTVTALTLQRIGISADATLSNVYLYDGDVRITDAASVSSGYITFTNAAGLFTVSGTKTISVKSDILYGTSGQTVGVTLTSVTLSSGTVTGTPISGNLFTIATATLAGVAVGVPQPATAITTDPGLGVRVWESTFTITNRNVTLSRLALRQINSITSADIQNFKLLVDGEQIATVQSLDSSGYVTFAGFTKTLATGTRNIKITADILGGSSRYVQMSLRNRADINVTDSQYGVGVAATGTFAASTGTIQVNQGTMTVVKATDSPSGNITNTASDQVLAKYTLTAYGEAIKVETLKIDFTYDGSPGVINNAAATFRNGRLLVNGAQVGSNTTLSSTGTGTQFTTNFIVTPGTPATLEVRADVYDNDGSAEVIDAGDTVYITLYGAAGLANAQRLVSLGSYDVPGAVKDANTLTVATGSMTLAKQSTYSNQTVVLPQTAYKIGAYNLTNGSTEAVNIYTLSLDVDEVTNATLNEDDLTNVYIKYGVNQTTLKTTLTSGGQDNDWSISYQIQKNEVLPIEVYADIASGATALDSFSTDLVVSGTGVSSSTTVTATSAVAQTIIAGTASISVALSGDSPAITLLDDSGTATVAAYKWSTVNDAYVITEVVVTLANSTSVQNVILKDGTTVLGTMPPNASSAVTFASLNIPIAANSDKTLTVDLQMSTIGVGGGTTDEAVTATLTSYKKRPVSSGVITESTPGTVASAQYAYKSVPTITLVALPSTYLSTGTKTLAKFTISSNGTGTVAWRKLLFTVAKNVAGVDTITVPTLWDSDSNTEITGTGVANNLGDGLSGNIVFTATNEQQISGAKTYELRATVDGAPVAGNSINTSIANPTTTHAAKNRAYAYNGTSYYYDVADAGTVTAADVRQTSQVSVSSAFVQTANTGLAVVWAAGDTTNDEALSFGTVTSLQDIVLTETGAATNIITNPISGTLVSTGGFTCLPKAGADGAGATDWDVADVLSILCTNATTSSQVVLNTAPVAPNAGLAVTTITLTTGTYAANSIVDALDSDVRLTLTAGAAATSSFLWSDISAASHGITTTDWMGDFKVKSLPTATQNLGL